VIGYPRWQDGAILHTRDYPPCHAGKIPRKLYKKSFIDQACSVKMAGYWLRSFFARLWTSTPSRSITWPISSHLDRRSLVSYPYLSTGVFTRRSDSHITFGVPKPSSGATSFPGTSLFVPRCGWSRVYVCQPEPHRGWVLNLNFVNTV